METPSFWITTSRETSLDQVGRWTPWATPRCRSRRELPLRWTGTTKRFSSPTRRTTKLWRTNLAVELRAEIQPTQTMSSSTEGSQVSQESLAKVETSLSPTSSSDLRTSQDTTALQRLPLTSYRTKHLPSSLTTPIQPGGSVPNNSSNTTRRVQHYCQ